MSSFHCFSRTRQKAVSLSLSRLTLKTSGVTLESHLGKFRLRGSTSQEVSVHSGLDCGDIYTHGNTTPSPCRVTWTWLRQAASLIWVPCDRKRRNFVVRNNSSGLCCAQGPFSPAEPWQFSSHFWRRILGRKEKSTFLPCHRSANFLVGSLFLQHRDRGAASLWSHVIPAAMWGKNAATFAFRCSGDHWRCCFQTRKSVKWVANAMDFSRQNASTRTCSPQAAKWEEQMWRVWSIWQVSYHLGQDKTVELLERVEFHAILTMAKSLNDNHVA